jgi:hypothetical protein
MVQLAADGRRIEQLGLDQWLCCRRFESGVRGQRLTAGSANKPPGANGRASAGERSSPKVWAAQGSEPIKAATQAEQMIAVMRIATSPAQQ